MPQTLPEGAVILPADLERIAAAQADLFKTRTAHAIVNVPVTINVHYDYPKHLMVGGKTVVVNSAAEEAKAVAAPTEADLDAVAKEEEIKAATAGEEAKETTPAPAKAKGPWGKKQ